MATQLSQSTIHKSSFPFHVILCLPSLLVPALLPPVVMAHEAWVLTPEQVAERNARPKPEIFTQLSAMSLAVYLLQGSGPYAMPLPSVPGTGKLSAWLAGQPRERAQWLLQLLAGANLLYLGLEYKFRQPNLMMGVLEVNHVPTLGMDPGTFVLWMAVVETLAGVLILSGVMIRPLSIGLFVSFAFFSLVLDEGVLSHIIFYGLLVPLITNGAGRWRGAVATDRSANLEIAHSFSPDFSFPQL